MKRIILLLVLAGALLGGWYAWTEYTRRPAGADEADVAHKVTAAELIAAFEADEQAALQRFSQGVVQVSGELIEVEPQGDKVNLHLTGDGPMSRVTCEFDAASAPAAAPGAQVTINGFCAGFTGFDVILQRCAIAR